MKKLLALVLSLLLCCALLACGKTAAPDAEPGEQPAADAGEQPAADVEEPAADVEEPAAGGSDEAAALPHEFVEKRSVGSYWYEAYTDGTATIIQYAEVEGSVPAEVSVPAEFDGLKVTAIGGGAFRSQDLTGVTIPDSVTEIGDSAFTRCGSLTRVTIPQSVTVIGESAFQWCDKLASIVIPQGVREIQAMTFASASRFPSLRCPRG